MLRWVVRSAIQEVLEGEGYVVQPAGDIGAAMARLEEVIPDLLIASPYIDCMSGHEAALYLRTRCHGLRVLLVGGFLEDDRLRDREEIQSFELFPKPFAATELLTKIKEVLLLSLSSSTDVPLSG